MTGYKPGDLIYSSIPYVYVLEENQKGKRCDYCFAERCDLKRCSQCHCLYFCNQNCQKNAWPKHKLECQLMKRSPKQLTKSLLLISRILLHIQKYGLYEPFEEVLGHKFNFDRLMAHSDKVSDESVATAYGILTSYFQDTDFISVCNLRAIIGKVRTNCFSILNENLRTIGGGLYLGGSAFDHSCDPNAEVVFNGLEIIIRAVKEIPKRDLSKIHISYIEQMQFTEVRQKYLSEHYHFTCQCYKCTSPYYDDMLTKTVIQNAECASLIREFEENIASIKQMVLNEAKPNFIYEACIEELQKQQKVLGDTHLYHVKVLEYAFDASVDKIQWTDAAVIGKQLVKPYKSLYGKYHPQVGIHLFKLGKIYSCLELLDSAKEHFMQAEEIIRITHGKDHPLYRELTDENLSLF